MKSYKNSFWVIATLLFFSTGLCGAQEIVDNATGKSFPSSVSFDYKGKQYTLTATGVAVRKKFFVKVYSVASYIEDPVVLKTGDVFANILNTKKAKQLTLQFIRDVPQKKLVSGYKESFAKVLTGNQEPVDKFLSFFDNVKAGDTHIFRALPDGTVTVLINGQEKGNLQNPEFAKTLWSIWFGNTGVVDRNLLISQIK